MCFRYGAFGENGMHREEVLTERFRRASLSIALTCSSLFVSPVSGKILFRRSHIRDVAVKRLIPIDEYCKVREGC